MSPLQRTSEPLPVMVMVPVSDAFVVKVPVWSLSGTHSVFVRPNPAAVRSVPAAGAAGAILTIGRPVAAVARRARTRSRSVRGTRSTTSTALPSDSVATDFSAGLPAGTDVPGCRRSSWRP